MRVLIINKFLYPNGGSETYIFKLGEALEQHGHEVQYFGMEHEGRCVGNRVNAYIINIQVLLEANGLAAGKDHQFKGRYDAEKNAVIISLEKDEQSALSPQKCTT